MRHVLQEGSFTEVPSIRKSWRDSRASETAIYPLGELL